MSRNRKIITIIAAAIAAAAVLFVFYPSAVMLIDRSAFSEEMKKARERVGRVGGEIYSQKTYIGTEMWYTYEDGYVIDYMAQYAVVFSSGRTLDEIRQTLRADYIFPLSEAEDPFMAWDAVGRVKKPSDTEGYYMLLGMPAPKISDTRGTGVHKFIYADKENRKDLNEQKKFIDEYKKEEKRRRKEEKKFRY